MRTTRRAAGLAAALERCGGIIRDGQRHVGLAGQLKKNVTDKEESLHVSMAYKWEAFPENTAYYMVPAMR